MSKIIHCIYPNLDAEELLLGTGAGSGSFLLFSLLSGKGLSSEDSSSSVSNIKFTSSWLLLRESADALRFADTIFYMKKTKITSSRNWTWKYSFSLEIFEVIEEGFNLS